MKVNTSRFGLIEVADSDIIGFSEGLLGFEGSKKFFIVDPADETLIMWLQSLDSPQIAFPILEPKLFKADYKVRLSANELRTLKIDSAKDKETLVYCILTIPEDVAQISANLKAPVVINTNCSVGRQVVLQENEYSVKFPVYKDLMAVLVAASSSQSGIEKAESAGVSAFSLKGAVSAVEVSGL